jgi:predicted transcriptional regulator
MAMTLRLTPEQDARLETLAKALGVSKQQAVIELLDTVDLSAARRVKLDGILDKVLKRDAELLERLADA